jgi:hypothetical protein
MKKKLIVLSGFVMSLAPVAALAQVTTTVGTGCIPGAPVVDLTTLMCKIGQLLNAIVPLLIALAVVYFVWGVVSYVISDDEEAKSKGRDRIIYGIIGLAVIIAMWGLVRILTNTFNVGNTGTITLPTVN